MTPAVTLSEAEAHLEAHEYESALDLLAGSHSAFRNDPRSEFRALLGEAWARMETGEVDEAVARLERARTLSELDPFGDIVHDRYVQDDHQVGDAEHRECAPPSRI